MRIADVEIDETAELTFGAAAPVAQALRAAVPYHSERNESGIVGQEEMIDFLIIGLLTGNHILLEGNPGLAKTETCKAVTRTLHLQFNRAQFMPDMMPSDLVGSIRLEVEGNTTRQRWLEGPIFANLLLADEINRASSKVQSSLLEGMGERQVTVVGRETVPVRTERETEELRKLAHANQRLFNREIHLEDSSLLTFSVMATMNPIEMEGTYPLGEAQLDRFMAKVVVPYPTLEELERIQLHQPLDTKKKRDAQAANGDPEPHGFDVRVSIFLSCVRKLLTSATASKGPGGSLLGKQYLQQRYGDLARQICWLTWFSHARPLGGGSDEAGGWSSDSGDAAASSQARAARQQLREWVRGNDNKRKAFAVSLLEALAGDAYPGVISGASPRGMARLAEAVLARALLHGRAQGKEIFPVQEDLEKVVRPILRHRIRLSSAATAANRSSDEAVDALLAALRAANEAS